MLNRINFYQASVNFGQQDGRSKRNQQNVEYLKGMNSYTDPTRNKTEGLTNLKALERGQAKPPEKPYTINPLEDSV